MEIKKYNKRSVESAKLFLFKNARNVSKAKSTKDVPNQTPEEEGYSLEDISEIDICFSIQYQSCFVKVFCGKKTFRLSIGKHEMNKWYSIQYSMATENDVSDNIILEEEQDGN